LVRSALAPAFVFPGVTDDGDVKLAEALYLLNLGVDDALILGLVFVATTRCDERRKRVEDDEPDSNTPFALSLDNGVGNRFVRARMI
jgi:hypothetical protein